MNEYGEILNCADSKITVLVNTDTIVPIYLHWAPKVGWYAPVHRTKMK